ncbi:receptor-like protein EIX2 [Senna tora]|uniref:Receptor-like protein EIX2 n=1 Tax=Senna tora TaxID=362788 RepID=A0A834TE85_9FABA|nr:receptor-like protein EIX2 [Senna tora]
MGSLSELQYLSIEDNLFYGVVKEVHLANFTRLIDFFASRNQLTLNVGPNWRPSFQFLRELEMESWNLGPSFPSWLQSLKHLSYLDISNNTIFESIPTWFWGTFNTAYFFNLSQNYINGELPNIVMNSNISGVYVDLSWNKMSGQLPYLSPYVAYLDLSSNQFSGSITHFLCTEQDEPKSLEFLNLASNNLSGEIPDCWMMWPYISMLKLENNYFTWNLPTSMGSLAFLEMLHLRNNNFSGKFPAILRNSRKLISLDLSENQFSGVIPSWIGQSLLNLKILKLASNRFSGTIPHQICDMSLLHILDLAQNNLTGNIPKCVNHLSAMLIINTSSESYISCEGNETSSVVEVLLLLKGRVDHYKSILGLVTSIDLSGNKLSGRIPSEITSLKGLRFLNLSNNLLSGQIPQSIGDMESLLSMDFSRNKLSGEIPPSMSKLSFLGLLNLSYNNLKGKIPTATQLQTFEASSFVGNDLCGIPLTIDCITNGVDHNDKEVDHKNGINWFFVSMALGFVVGFWGVVGPLLYSRSWRHAYFGFIDDLWFKIRLDILLMLSLPKSPAQTSSSNTITVFGGDSGRRFGGCRYWFRRKCCVQCTTYNMYGLL